MRFVTEQPSKPRSRASKLMPAILLAVLVLTAALVGVAYLTGGDDGQPGGNSDAKPVTIDGVTFLPWKVGDPARFPDNLAVIVEQGCFECAPPGNRVRWIARVSRDALGTIRTETLFAARPSQALTSGAAIPEGAYILEVAARADASEIVVTVCATGGCSQEDQLVPNPATVLYRSTDGGATWAEYGRPGGVASAVLVAKDGVVLATYGGSGATYTLFPGGQPLPPPNGTKDARIQVTPTGEIAWVGIDASGTLRLMTATTGTPLPALQSKATLVPPVYFLDDSHLVTTSEIQSQRSADAWPRYNAVSTLDGKVDRGFTGARVVPIAAISVGVVIGDITLPPENRTTVPNANLPGLIDYNTGTISPITVPFAGPGEHTPARVIAAIKGPFVRVIRRDACAEVRSEARAESPPGSVIVACYPANVLLKWAAGGDTQGWYAVTTLDGKPGFISIEHAEK